MIFKEEIHSRKVSMNGKRSEGMKRTVANIDYN